MLIQRERGNKALFTFHVDVKIERKKEGRRRHLEPSCTKVQRHLVLISYLWIQFSSMTAARSASIVILVGSLHSWAKVVFFHELDL